MSPSSPYRILVVDDVAQNIRLMRGMLKRAGYVVMAAMDGAAALRMARESTPDLILLDVMMPGLDGYAVCGQLKEAEATRHIPVIFVTALSDTRAEINCFAAGAADFICKPVTLPVLLARVKAHLAVYEQHRDLQGMFRDVVESAPDALVMSDAQGRIVRLNALAEQLTGYDRAELIGQSIEVLLPERSRAEHPGLREGFAAAAPGSRHMRSGRSVQARHKDGSLCEVEVSLSRIQTPQGPLVVSALRDVTARRQAEAELRIAAAAFESQEGMVITDANEIVVRSNRAFTRITGYGADEVVGRKMNFLKSDRHNDAFWHDLWQVLLREGVWQGELWNRHKDGRVVPHWLTISAVKDGDGRVSHYVGAYTEIAERKRIEEALLSQNIMLSGIIQNFPGGVSVVDEHLTVLAHNEQFAKLLDFPASLLGKPGLNFEDFVRYNAERGEYGPGDPAQQIATAMARARSFQAHRFERVRPNGQALEIRGEPLPNGGFVTIYIDITERKRAEEQLRIAAAAFDSQEGMVVTDAHNVILRVNRAFTEITGYSAAEAVGQTPRLLQSGLHDAAFYRDMWEAIGRTGGWRGEIWDKRKNGEIYPKWLTISAVKGDNGAVTHYIGAQYDITERKKAEAKIAELAFFDQLTGLPNRTLMLDRLKQAMTNSARAGRYAALLIIDLDHFKTLNDTLGHDVGDALLKQVGKRLSQCVRDGDSVARLGGDEFVVILASLSASEVDAGANIKLVAKKIQSALNQTYQLDEVAHHSTASIGATLFVGQHASAEDLMKQADLAMYRAKASGRNAVRFFDPEMETAVLTRVALERDLDEAIGAAQFLLHYQPQVNSEGGVMGAEALVRWKHPKRGMVSPDEFIPLAEQTGLILPLGHWVLDTACAQLALWANWPGMAHLTIAVNVSAHQFRQADFVDQVLMVLQSHGVNPHRLKLELTESLLVDNMGEIVEKMSALKALGVGFSLDDFGTGYSSLSYLKRLPLDQLKIDRSFVADVLTDANDAAIARTIVALANSLGLAVIAEGVETEAQRAFLAEHGCHAYQGYLFSRPLPVEGFELFALSHRSQEGSLIAGDPRSVTPTTGAPASDPP